MPNRKRAIRSLIAYLNNPYPSTECEHGHVSCAIRKGGVCSDELIHNFPEYADMTTPQLWDELERLRNG